MGVKSTKSTKDTKGAAGTATHKGTVGDSATSGAPVSGKRQ